MPFSFLWTSPALLSPTLQFFEKELLGFWQRPTQSLTQPKGRLKDLKFSPLKICHSFLSTTSLYQPLFFSPTLLLSVPFIFFLSSPFSINLSSSSSFFYSSHLPQISLSLFAPLHAHSLFLWVSEELLDFWQRPIQFTARRKWKHLPLLSSPHALIPSVLPCSFSFFLYLLFVFLLCINFKYIFFFYFLSFVPNLFVFNFVYFVLYACIFN